MADALRTAARSASPAEPGPRSSRSQRRDRSSHDIDLSAEVEEASAEAEEASEKSQTSSVEPSADARPSQRPRVLYFQPPQKFYVSTTS